MLNERECNPCIHKISVMTIGQLTSDEDLIGEVVSEIQRIPAVQELNGGLTCPEIYELVFKAIGAAFNDPDPFKSLKERQNRKGLQLYPRLKTLVDESDDPLYTATKLAILGNSVDVIWSEGADAIEQVIRDKKNIQLHQANFRNLRERIERSRLIVYIGDNSGEIVLDRLLIETMKRVANAEVIFVVRSVATANDVTLAEAKSVGMDDVATVIENGVDGPLPGTILSRCSAEVKNSLRQADLIISKGGGNLGSLNEERDLPAQIFYLLMCKCAPYARRLQAKLYDPILYSGAPG